MFGKVLKRKVGSDLKVSTTDNESVFVLHNQHYFSTASNV